MKFNYFHIVKRSLSYNLRSLFYQVIIILILTAVITGSLMTGKSVRTSLRKNSLEKIGNTGILVSSGLRYFDPTLAARIIEKTGFNCTGILEIEGYCQNFSTGGTASQVKIFAVDDNFFSFQGNIDVKIAHDEVLINEKLADYLQLKPGDDLIIRFRALSDIPSDAPFSPGRENTGSKVMKISGILGKNESGNFSLGISQITPLNIFVNRSDLSDSEGNIPKINRLMFDRKQEITLNNAAEILRDNLRPQDIGLSLRFIPQTGGYEMISNRIFIDQSQLDEIVALPVKSYPVITYLANSLKRGSMTTPYTFVSALDSSQYKGVPSGENIVISQWLADDLEAETSDTITLTWYSPDPLNRLQEERSDFIISGISDSKGIWADSLLMPEFPGISGSKTCRDWDAGISINTRLIRQKDEEYWNRFRGRPKAFINYNTGRKLWGNNFGPVTALRFENEVDSNILMASFEGSIDPLKAGFILSDLPAESIKAADASVDFSTLFLSLGFFVILSSIILLILIVSTFYDSRKQQVKTLFSLGFSNYDIDKLLFFESVLISVTGAFLGTFAGALFNKLIIRALNSVWSGAVQTDTLMPGTDIFSIIYGFFASVTVILLILKINSSSYLKKLSTHKKDRLIKPSVRVNLYLSTGFFFASVIVLILSAVIKEKAIVLSFISGVLLFVALILFIRQYYISRYKTGPYGFRKKYQITGSYFSIHPSNAIAPVVFLSAGLFAVMITAVNRMDISSSMLEKTGGTGGYQLWGESSVPFRSNLSDSHGRQEYGLDDPEFGDLVIVSARKKSGDDASCLNLNHIASPPILGIDPGEFIKRGSFSFSTALRALNKTNPWESLNYPPANGTIYGVADQTVLQYGLKLKIGDTLKIRSESGQILNVIIAAGLKSSVFQGYLLIGNRNFIEYFPSVSGSQVFLADGDPLLTETYRTALNERLSEFGIHFEPAADRLSSFFIVTNTYLSVFMILGSIGMILGVAGLGFILIRNFNQRKRDFGFMMAAGFSIGSIRSMIFTEQAVMLLYGTVTGILSALLATKPSLAGSTEIPWKTVLFMILLIVAAGFTALAVSIRSIKSDTLISKIRRE